MRKVGPAALVEAFKSDPAGPSESEQDFKRALTEVQAVSGALEVCYGKGEASVTERVAVPEVAEFSQEEPTLEEHPGIVDPLEERRTLLPIDTEVEGYLVGLEFSRPLASRQRAVNLLERGRTPGQETTGKKADIKA